MSGFGVDCYFPVVESDESCYDGETETNGGFFSVKTWLFVYIVVVVEDFLEVLEYAIQFWPREMEN